MKKKLLLAATIAVISIQVSADYLIRYNVEPQPNSITIKDLSNTSPTSAEPTYTAWQGVGNPFNCSIWTPDSNTIQIGQNFTQERSCSVNEERKKQNRVTLENGSIRNEGAPITESRISQLNQTQSAIGGLTSWISIAPTYTDWVNSGISYDCTDWTPAPSTVTVGVSFTQNATDCKLNQTRNSQSREQETTTLEIRNVGSVIVNTQTLTNQASSRSSTGTLETWVTYEPATGPWTNSGVAYDCTNWSPSPATVAVGVPFTQTATDCKLNQTRNVQNREQETTTLSIRNVGSQTTGSQVLTAQTDTRSSVGTLPVDDCRFSTASATKNYWQEYRSASNSPYLQIWFENVRIVNDASVGTKVVGGYTYTRGALVSSGGTGIGYIAKYYICRK